MGREDGPSPTSQNPPILDNKANEGYRAKSVRAFLSTRRMPRGQGVGRSSHPGLLPEAWSPDADVRTSRFDSS